MLTETVAEAQATGLDAVQFEQFEAILAHREQEEITAELDAEAAAEGVFGAAAGAAGDAAAARVGAAALRLIVDHETGGRAFYEQVIKSRPIWPRASSGITIGFGYDLGYVTRDAFRSDWADLLGGLPGADRAALEGCVGFHSGKDSAATMQGLLAGVRHITIGWAPSEAVFRARTLPKFALSTQGALPNTGLLNGDCFGVLVSLTFNRGASYSRAHNPATDPKDRFREMRAIKAAMAARRFDEIPALLKAMIRLWVGTAVETGLKRRRNDEAALFLSALASGDGTEAPGGMMEAAATESPAADLPAGAESVPAETRGDEDFWTETTEEDLEAEAAEGLGAGILAGAATWAADAVQPDYAHLGGNLIQGAAFALAAADLDLLARLNDFDLSATDVPVLFGLRGCGIVKDHTAGGPVLVDLRPDHSVPRCVIGVWDRRAGKVAVFPGSTVPNQAAVAKFRRDRSAGNLLGTGLYGYVCGPHITSKTTPGCFLLREPGMAKRVVVVRRSANDLSYQMTDLVDRCAPGDNIHPTFFGTPVGFSSLGCQTVVGTFKDGVHHGPWAAFRKAAGLNGRDGEPGKPYLYLLLTGAEARLAARLRADGLDRDPVSLRRLRRLRFGSSGQQVKLLQKRLELDGPDGRMGPFTSETLHKAQARLAGSGGSDGIYSPDLDARLGWSVFSTLGV